MGHREIEGEIFHVSSKTVPTSYETPEGSQANFYLITRTGPRLARKLSSSVIVPNGKDQIDNRLIKEFSREELKTILADLLNDERLVAGIKSGENGLEFLLDRHTQLQMQSELQQCLFCYPNITEKTPKPRISHEGLFTPYQKQVISFPSPTPTMPNHILTAFTDHKTDLANLSFGDMVNYFFSGRQIAEQFKRDGAIGIVDFLDWGLYAGASGRHPHAQRGQLIRGMEHYYRQSKMVDLIERLEGYEGYSSDIMNQWMQNVKTKYGNLFVFENDYIFVYATPNPRHPDQTEVIFKNAGNILDFNYEDLRMAASSMLGIIHALRSLRGVTDLNLVLHQSSFNSGKNGFKMQAVIHPRNTKLDGGLEVGQGVYIIPVKPEDTAHALRAHYSGR